MSMHGLDFRHDLSVLLLRDKKNVCMTKLVMKDGGNAFTQFRQISI